MKKISIYSLAIITTTILSGCGGGGGSSSNTTTNTIGAGETKTLSAGTVITSYSGTCSPNIVVNIDGTWTVTNSSSNSGDICQYN